MKTAYQKPAMTVIAVKHTLMNPISKDIVEHGQNLGTAPETGATSGNLSKKNIWADPELDEEEED